MATPPDQPSAAGPPQTKPATATAPKETTATTAATTATSDSPLPAAESSTSKPTTAQPPASSPTAKVETPAVEPAAQPAAGPAATEAPAAAPTASPAASPAASPEAPPPPPQAVLPASHWAQIPHPEEDELDDGDSAYGDDNASSTASLSASILQYRTLHGRTFHSERGNAQSWNPNDALHDESMDILHHASTLMQDGKLSLVPFESDKVMKVLDVGCGTGIWAIDFADMYPLAEVIGVDISPSQPQWIPPNLKFEIDDITLPWTYPPSTFDFVHMRWLVGAIPNWNSVFEEAYKSLKPGGIFESIETSCLIQSDDNTVPPGCALDQWGQVFQEAGRKFGRTFTPVEDDVQRIAMEHAGFVDIKSYDYKVVLGSWPADPKIKEMGQYARLGIEQDIEGFLLYMWTSVLGWTREEIAVYAAHLRRELHSPNFHSWYPQRVVIGRKPESAV
ncbi:S-adenosyl-L-methionine-dependent methyltransferase [Xylaria intraflava]|nr:S-adenosyl-L-methionine-dependent methyltransferase [Xylaria intraflava]